MKVLAKLLGRVNVFNPAPDFSYVTLKNVDNGEVVDANADSKKLTDAGITQKDDEFEILIIEDEQGKQTAKITKLQPKSISAERVAEIKEEFKDRWSFGGEGAGI